MIQCYSLAHHTSADDKLLQIAKMICASVFGQSALNKTKSIASFGCNLQSITCRYASQTSSSPKRTCLYEFHVNNGARMEEFAGYAMPIVYKGQTIKQEHIQTRTSSSAFDVSHMMQTIIRGKDRARFLEKLTVADVSGMRQDRCTLSVFTNSSGGIIDDCIIGNRSDHIHLVSNAGNAEKVANWLLENRQGTCKDMDVSLERLQDFGLVALQGPKSAEVLQSLVDVDLAQIEFMSSCNALVAGVGQCLVTRCGYTGEDGFEISVEPGKAERLMQVLCEDFRVKPAGLGARDTLRLEAGLCLHGHDISESTTPVEAALAWTIQKRRRTEGGFIGADVVLPQLKNPPARKRGGLIEISVGPPAREGSVITLDDGTNIGTVTSGNYGPSIGKNIAMAYIPRHMADKYGQLVQCAVRGKQFQFAIAKMPFVNTNYYIKRNL